MPGRYKVMHAEDGKRPMQRDARDPGEAAAVALDYATQHLGPYVILGTKAAVDMIPEPLRHKS